MRQLEHAVEVACIRAAGEGALQIERKHGFRNGGGNASSAEAEPTFAEATRRFQRELLEGTLDESHWNVGAAARQLDLARSHTYALIKAFGLTMQRS